ncbi:MAG: PspA/IM30 family protein [Proteobacteria bacterium]|nr:PspA/IM30 family protein [Pseudomonadota bacterium]
MNVFNRMTNIVHANISSVLDEAEDPAKMIRHMIREMEETLCHLRSASARHIAESQQLTEQANYHMAQCGWWAEKAELAVSRGRDDLARGALIESSKHKERASILCEQRRQIDESLARLQSDTNQLSEKLKAAQARRKGLVLRRNTASTRIRVKRQLHHIGHEEVLARFEAYEHQLDVLAGQDGGQGPGAHPVPGRALASEINALAREQAIADDLASLKQRITNRREVRQ